MEPEFCLFLQIGLNGAAALAVDMAVSTSVVIYYQFVVLSASNGSFSGPYELGHVRGTNHGHLS